MNLSPFPQSLSLLTDFYQLSMSYAYWKAGLDQKEAVFHLFFRKRPFQGGFTIAAGLETVVHFLEQFRFQTSDLDYLSTLKTSSGAPIFSDDFFEYLSQMKFSCDIDAVEEGTVVFPYEPLVRVKGPLVQCQLLETPLLNLINFPTLIATKAARINIAANGDPVFEFGLRRAQGVDGALTASRASYIGGCCATSNVLAGKLYGIPLGGTHSHSWVLVFEEELEAFKTFAEYLPEGCVFLVDTFNSIEGVKHAIVVAKELALKGHALHGIRLDSGDLAYLSLEARKLLDQANLQDVKIYASNELDEVIISELKRQGAQIKVWGVGTSLVTGKNQGALDGVYKLSAIRDPGEPWQYKLKLSEQMVKISNPGILQVRRFHNHGEFLGDVIYDEQLSIHGDCYAIDPIDPLKEKIISHNVKWENLLVPIFKKGIKIYQCPSLDKIRERKVQQLDQFPTGIKRFLNPQEYNVWMEKEIYELKADLIKKIRKKNAVHNHNMDPT